MECSYLMLGLQLYFTKKFGPKKAKLLFWDLALCSNCVEHMVFLTQAYVLMDIPTDVREGDLGHPTVWIAFPILHDVNAEYEAPEY